MGKCHHPCFTTVKYIEFQLTYPFILFVYYFSEPDHRRVAADRDAVLREPVLRHHGEPGHDQTHKERWRQRHE